MQRGSIEMWGIGAESRLTGGSSYMFYCRNDMRFHPCSQFDHMVHVKVGKLPLVSFIATLHFV